MLWILFTVNIFYFYVFLLKFFVFQTRSFDEDAKESRAAALRAANKSGTGFGESYSLANPSIRAGEDIPQPTIFNGKLKGYQLKGMNWLANLYEQVNFKTMS